MSSASSSATACSSRTMPGFDRGFINMELGLCGRGELAEHRFVDTLVLARRRHPNGPNSLDALCARYGIDNSARTKHGALLDAEILAEVYLELLGGRQATFVARRRSRRRRRRVRSIARSALRPRPLAPAPHRSRTNAPTGPSVRRSAPSPLWLRYLRAEHAAEPSTDGGTASSARLRGRPVAAGRSCSAMRCR